MIEIPLLEKIKTVVVNPVLEILMVLGLVWFLYGVLQFMMGFDNEERRTAGKQHMIWGIIGLFIMVSVFGIMNAVCYTITAC